MDNNIEQILIEIGLFASSFAIQFFLPGFGGLFLSGLVNFGASLGIQINQGNLTQNPMYYVTRLLAIFMPQLKKIALQKMPLLVKVENIIDKTSKIIGKFQNLFMDDFVKAVTDPKNFFNRGNGLSQNLENDVKKIEIQNKVQDTLGKDIVAIEPIYRFAPNTKNPKSWIMSVEFQEIVRFGNKIIGQMTITYCFNNRFRIGERNVPVEAIIHGRTSQGKINRKEEKANKERYRTVSNIIDSTKYRLVRVTFNDCSFYGDFLPFLRSYSWGSYYMSKWMIGNPSDQLSPLIFIGSLRRVYSKVTAVIKQAKEVTNTPEIWLSKNALKLGLKFAGKIKIGTKSKFSLAKVTSLYSKANQIQKNPLALTTNQLKNYAHKIKRKVLKKRKGM